MSQPLEIGCFFSPPLMEEVDGRWTGPLVDLASAVLEKVEASGSFKNMTQAQLNTFDEQGFDLALGVFVTRRRGRQMLFTNPLLAFHLQGLSTQDYALTGIEQAKVLNLRFAVIEGSIGHDFLLAEYSEDDLRRCCVVFKEASPEELWSELSNARVDVLLGDSLTLAFWMDKGSVPFYWSFRSPIDEVPMALAFHPRNATLLDALRNYIGHEASIRLSRDCLFALGVDEHVTTSL